MSGEGKRDEAKGRIEKAAGELTGDADLKRKGDLHKAEGKAKQAIDKAADKLGGKDR